jgi:hypothetical protein
MGTVVQAGSINVQSLIAPGVIVNILPPSQSSINGVPTNIVGFVGSAPWGLKNTPVIVGSMNEYVQNFGIPQNRLFDMGTAVYAATLNFANNFRCVRITDGTDISASIAVKDVTAPTAVTGLTLTGKYTGSLGNSIKAEIQAGSRQNTFRITVGLPANLSAGLIPEVFDNIPGAGATLWQNIVNAINEGIAGVRGASNFVVATIGTATALPALTSYTLTGGTDGASSITPPDIIGLDISPRTAMYALRGSQCSVAALVDLTDTSTYTDQLSFGISEGMLMHIQGASGQTLSQAVTDKNTAGIDNYAAKFLVGDWAYMFDAFNGITRLVSPQGFACGVKANLLPSESALNKPILGITGTQTTQSGGQYSNADITFACDNGLDFIYNPSPGGQYFSLQTGQNTSSDPLTRTDAYTTLTNYIAYSIAFALGIYIGQLQNPTVRQNAYSTLNSFLLSLFNLQMIGDVNFPNDPTKAFKVVLDASNNPSDSVVLGYMQASVEVVDFSVIRNFIVNLQNGQPTLQSVTQAPVIQVRR